MQKDASLPATLRRDNHTNNREGYFFVTLRIRDDAPTLNTIIVKFDALDDNSNAPRCNYTKLGKRVLKVWRNVSTYHPCVLLDVEIIPIAVGCRFHLGYFEYHKKDVKLKHEMCMVMNQLVRVITAVKDEW